MLGEGSMATEQWRRSTVAEEEDDDVGKAAVVLCSSWLAQTKQRSTAALLGTAARRGEAGGYALQRTAAMAARLRAEQRRAGQRGGEREIGDVQGVGSGIFIPSPGPCSCTGTELARRQR